MLELIKIVWEVFVLRDSARKGQMNLRIGVIASLFVVAAYAILIPAITLYDKYPQYKPLFVSGYVLVGIDLALCCRWAIRAWHRQVEATRTAESTVSGAAAE